MKIGLELPDELVDELNQQSRRQQISPGEYAAELLTQALASQSLSDDVRIENRPDWQAALNRSRQDIRAGRTVDHCEVEEWHKSHSE